MGFLKKFKKYIGGEGSIEQENNNNLISEEKMRKASIRKKRYRVASVLACVVAFTTTYALILPAITVEKDEAEEMPGMKVEDKATLSFETLKEGDFLQITPPEGEEGEPHIAIVVETDAESEEAASVFVLEKDPEDGIQITEVAADDSTVSLLTPEEAVEYEGLEEEVLALVQAAEEEELLEPEELEMLEEEVSVVLGETKELEENSSVVGQGDESSEVENDDEVVSSEVTNLEEDSSATPQNDDSVILNEVKDPAEEPSVEPEEDSFDVLNEAKNLAPATETIIDAAMNGRILQQTADGITVTARWEEGVLPEGVEMSVRAVEPTDYKDLVDETLGKTRAETQSLDITFRAGGKEVEPTGNVRITFRADFIDQKASPEVVHINADGTAEVMNAKVLNDEITLTATSFSVYVIRYTVDFHWEVAGQVYSYSFQGGSYIDLLTLVEALGIGEDDPEAFVADIETIEFSNTDLVWAGKAEEDTTVGELKEANGLECQYSAELTEEEIAEINAQPVAAGTWVLISMKPFDTEEYLEVTMKNGDEWILKVTDAKEITDSEATTIDVNKSYLICYQVGNDYYMLKNDGSVEKITTTNPQQDFEGLNSTYCWSFNHIFKEQDVEHHLDKNYYLIRPIDDRSKTLSLNNAGEALVQSSNNNIAVIQDGNGFILEGYHNVGTDDEPRYIHLGFNNGSFLGLDGDGVKIHIYEMNALPIYDYTVRSADETRGTVTVAGGTQRTEQHEGSADTHYYEATSNHDKKNASTITATPVNHKNSELHPLEQGYDENKWEFDHWELDGLPLDRNQYEATITVNTLPIPHNGSKLVAFFRQNPNYVVPASEKEPSSIEDMTGWLEDLKNRSIPLDSTATKKTAEVYDYQNRIYRVDFTSKANFETFAGNLDMAFCLDVSNSMKFPSSLVKANTSYNNNTNPIPIYQINNGGYGWSNQGWLDRERGWNNPYYLIADASGTATVFRIYYQAGYWKAQDASRSPESEKSFRIGVDEFETNYGENKSFPFSKGDNSNTNYTIYNAGDGGKSRFYYLNENFSSGAGELNYIQELLHVAGDSSPNVLIAYNTFNKVKKTTVDFGQAEFNSDGTLRLDDLEYNADGGTRPDLAFDDARNLNWQSDNKYVILVTDGAPQGGDKRSDTTSTDRFKYARDAADRLKADGVKLITIGLSMDKVDEGKKLLYDIADSDKSGSKMFYLAESANDLGNIFRQITKTLMEDAVVLGDITDTVGEAFYLVDKATGMPLKENDKIDIEGNLTSDQSKVAGIVQSDGKTIKWIDQPIDSVAGWHGTVYVKAQEELLGGNGVNTNDGEASIVATKYHVGGKDVPFDTTLARDTLNLTANLPSPKVNVNELTFFNNETEWTVYLGTEVDPKKQLRAIYDSLVVEEVVNEDGSLHYTIDPNSIEERWDDINEGTSSKVATYSLSGLIESLIRKNSLLEEKYFNGSELNWDAFLGDILFDGITLPYREYGLTDNGNIKITLEKTIDQDEESDLIDQSPHKTTVTGNEVEKYVFRIAYEPDYSVTPIGQGGESTANFHTGIFGSMYQGHAAGRETSTNTHVINVYAEPLDIEKVDDYGGPVEGAEFKLYRKVNSANEEEVTKQESLATYNSALTGSYYCISSATSGSDGVVHLAPGKENSEGHTIPVADGETGQNLLVPLEAGEIYYLVETKVPTGYQADNTVRTVRVQVGPELFTKLDKTTPVESSNILGTPARPVVPYNWEEGVTFMVGTLGQNGEVLEETPAEMVNHEKRGKYSPDRTYMLASDSSNLAVFDIRVLNSIVTDISILKVDSTSEGSTGLTGAVFQLKRVNGSEESYVEGVEGLGTITKEVGGETKKFDSAFETDTTVHILRNLPDGIYRLYEVVTPSGYNRSFDYVEFKMENHLMKDVTTEHGEDSDVVKADQATDNTLALITISNTPGAVLPETGGPGQEGILAIGGLLVISAAAGLMFRRRKLLKHDR